MDWQQAVTLLIVAITAGLFLRRAFRRRKFAFDRDTACGCSAATSGSRGGSIKVCGRKGERPRVIVRPG